jgi:hypothetical protein
MAQTNYTPISLYYSATASNVPTAANLVPGELAINTNDGKLYYEDSSGVVQVLATKSTGSIGGSNTQVQFNNSGSLGGSSGLTWDGSFLTTSSIKNSALTSGRVTYAGASGLLTDSANLQFTGSVLGVGVTPSTWFNDYRVMQLGAGASLSGRTTNSDSMQLMANVYRDASADYRYIDTNVATQYQQTSGVHLWYNAPSGTAGNVISFTERMRITSAGNVGIGTSSPAQPLQIGDGTSAGYQVVRVLGTNCDLFMGQVPATRFGLSSGTYTTMYNDANQALAIGTIAAYPLVFGTSNAEQMRITSSGELLVSTTAAVGGNAAKIGVLYDGAAYWGLGFKASTTTGTDINFANASGTTVGSVSHTASLTLFNTTSDQRLKTNIVDAPSGNIDDIKVRSFDWIADGSHQEYGMVAQELIEVAPYAVTKTENPDDMMQVDYSKLVPMMIKEIQDLKQRIATLENK